MSCKDHGVLWFLVHSCNGHEEFAGGKVLFSVHGALGFLFIPARGYAGEVVLSEAPQQ